METCPFCGKAFKRLKSHLPYCKMAGAKNNPNATEQAKKNPKTGMKKALLVEAKEQNLNNEGDDTMEVTKKKQLNKKKQKHLEPSSCRTQKIMLEDKEKEHLKKHIQNSNLDRANGNSLLIDTEENRSDQCPIEGPTILTTLQSLEVASSLEPTNPLHIAVTPSQTSALQALPGSFEFLKASEDNWTWPNRKADFRGAIGKSRSSGVKSTVYEEVSKKALLVEAKEQYLEKKILQNPKVASSLAPTDLLHVADSKKALLVEAKEKYLNNEGDDTMEMTKKAQLNKKKHSCQEFCRTQQFTHEENEREHVKKDIKNNNLGHTHDNDHLIDKEENRSDYCPIEGSSTLTSLWSPEVATSIVHTDPLHGAVTPSQTSALQALQGGSELLKTSEDNFTWPNYKGDFRGAIEKMANIGIKSPLYEDVSKKASLVDAKEQCVKNKEDDNTLTWPNHKGNFTGSIEKAGSLGIKLPLYKEVSKVMEDKMPGEDHCSFQNGFKGSFNESLFQKPELPSEPISSFLPSTMVFSSHRPHSDFPRHGDYVQLPHISHQMQTHKSNALKSMEKSLEGQLDLTPANETKTPRPVRDVLSRNCSLGLQWIPELHSNYIQLKIVPEQINLKSSSGRMGESIAPGPFDPESCWPTQRQPIPEVPLTSRRLMDVRIGDLPSWLALQRLSMKTIPELGVTAWTRYYNKYINVRKGGIGGLAMLLTGYCVLSYSWNYHRIRTESHFKYLTAYKSN
ncbi:hypothetical protein AB205_0121890 [Aquarana catesbeiana]|uniref:Uncharacterized protein n=1 Tax=Aquarana catesbeiana TaxID=8400 RepID=A0A2G9R4U7_AQUCT|nr:hypothetical protein AB205_0121890 [Aquarana catesbeiana]